MIRIAEEEAPRPSVRLAGLGERLPDVAARRKTEPARLVKLVRGELDWIALKALEKARDRRYETANAFARDVHRYLDDEPVEACPPSVRYRLGKVVRRHRVLLATAAFIVAALLVTIYALNDARRQAVRAFEAEADQRKALDAQIKAERGTRKALNMFSATLHAMVHKPSQLGAGEKALLRRILQGYQDLLPEPDASSEALATAAEGQFQIAGLRVLLGEAKDAEAAYQRAVGLYERLASEFPDDPAYQFELARCSFDHGFLLQDQGRRSDAEAAYGRAVGVLEKLVAAFPTEARYRRELADCYNDFGVVLREDQDWTRAADAYRKAIALGERVAAEEPGTTAVHVSLAANYHNLGNIVRDQGDAQAALAWYGKAIDRLAGIDDPSGRAQVYLCNAHWDRANALGQLGRHADAVKDWQQAIDLGAVPAKPHLQLFLEAEQAEQKLKAQSHPTGEHLQEAAATQARAAGAAEAAGEPGLKERYVRRALALLEQAKAIGWFRDPQRVKQLKEDKAFDALPPNEFKLFLGSLNGTPP
jgi:tetratricopeptide (TPR) repeat protein